MVDFKWRPAVKKEREPVDEKPLNSEQTPEEAQRELKHEVRELVKLVVLFLAIFIVLKSFVIEGYEVQGESMLPTLQENDQILVFKLPHLLSRLGLLGGIEAIKPRDIIVFDSPDSNNKRYVKRVIAEGPPAPRGNVVGAQESAEPHVSVRIAEGRVFVDNHPVQEDYLPKDAMDRRERDPEIQLAPGEYYVLGDNRGVSKDSRSFKAIHDNAIVGKAVLRFWPLSKFGLLK